MPSAVLQENTSRILLENNAGALLMEGVEPGTLVITEPTTAGSLTVKDGAA